MFSLAYFALPPPSRICFQARSLCSLLNILLAHYAPPPFLARILFFKLSHFASLHPRNFFFCARSICSILAANFSSPPPLILFSVLGHFAPSQISFNRIMPPPLPRPDFILQAQSLRFLVPLHPRNFFSVLGRFNFSQMSS